MNDSWPQALARLQHSATPHVLVTILGAHGSTPCNAGTKMVITREQSFASIGGGNLEFQAINRARCMLEERGPAQVLEHVLLGADLGQCCGGSTSLLFERLQPTQVRIALFGAGHIGQALLPILATLPVQLFWIDERTELLQLSGLPNINQISEAPIPWISQLPAGVFYLVMTHSHALDLVIVEAVLQRGDAAFLGLIGSVTKSRRFRLQLRQKGFTKEQIKQLHCPLGLTTVPGKSPAEIAVSIAGEVIGRYHRHSTRETHTDGLDWVDLKSLEIADGGGQ
ncbi:MAG TPA: xanthine dehydrogenase accessory protein XdhC [Gammaproteobacteria bacterium]|nr:xanthine dehydrogenase accessory protein XdhC [Gammaproteobacteria bacterium]